MDDKDRVFARFRDDKPEASDRRELLTIPRRAGASGSRVVEVVRVRSGGAVRDRQQRVDPHVRAASWEDGFQAKQAVAAPALLEPIPAVEAPPPTTHVMPAWEPPAAAVSEARDPEAPAVATTRGRGRPRKHPPQESAAVEMAAPAADEGIAIPRRGSGRPPMAIPNAPTRHVADPFDSSDDGANCMRCGYAIEPARENRGLMTCAACK